MIFIELPLFTEQITNLVSDQEYAEFQKQLLLQPEQGDVIPGTGGLRKTRLRLPGRGKRGGARVIYLRLPQQEAMVLFYVYTKAANENLNPDQLRRLRNAVAVIKQEFKP